MDQATQRIAVLLIIGLIAGFLASLIVGGGGLVRYLLSGILGALVGSFVFSSFGINLGIKNALLSQIVQATVGAIIIVVLARIIA